MTSNLTRKQLRRVEVLQALAPLTRSTQLMTSASVDGYDLRQLADWVLQEGEFALVAHPPVERVFTSEQVGAVGLTDEAEVHIHFEAGATVTEQDMREALADVLDETPVEQQEAEREFDITRDAMRDARVDPYAARGGTDPYAMNHDAEKPRLSAFDRFRR